MQPTWRAAIVAATLLFASASLLAAPFAEAQLDASGNLGGLVCTKPDYEYGPYPMKEGEFYGWCPTSQGLPAATVRITKPGPVAEAGAVGGVDESVETDDTGRFDFTEIPQGEYTLTVTRAGFADHEQDVEVDEDTEIFVELDAESVTVTGTVRGEDEDPIEGAEVSLCCPMEPAQDTTGDLGNFALAARAGWYSLDVRAPGHEGWSEYRLFDGAEPVEVTLRALPPPDATLRGSVVDQKGNPVEGARVEVYSYGGGCCYDYAEGDDVAYSPGYYGGGSNWTTTDANGRYEVRTFSGGGSVTFSKDGYASLYQDLYLEHEQAKTMDVELLRYPEKTAEITGRIVDAETGEGLRLGSLNVRAPQYGRYECSTPAGQGAGGSGTTTMAESRIMSPEPYPYHDPGCAITIRADGTFSGMVTPGYTILNAWFDHWSSCTTTTDADGSSRTECGKEYYSWSRTMTLADNSTTEIVVALQGRPEPDAIVSGYVVDGATQTAIPGATISFSNQDTYGWGSAQADGDGSYKLRLRSGYHTVSVWAEGFLSWEGVLEVPAGETPFDVVLTPGRESYGGCCYGYPTMYREGVASDSAHGATYSSTSAPMPQGADGGLMGSPGALGDSDESAGGGEGEMYEDLNGGLGPYDPEERRKQLGASVEGGDKGSPAPAMALLGVLLVAVAGLVRRRLA